MAQEGTLLEVLSGAQGALHFTYDLAHQARWGDPAVSQRGAAGTGAYPPAGRHPLRRASGLLRVRGQSGAVARRVGGPPGRVSAAAIASAPRAATIASSTRGGILGLIALGTWEVSSSTRSAAV
ncbi:hypothetical protein IWGMT90018_26030 [Mycobacterium kiyosense]|nr:hypothetical protein IWGMT90018_26030 [Mycobacterium kiyosense]